MPTIRICILGIARMRFVETLKHLEAICTLEMASLLRSVSMERIKYYFIKFIFHENNECFMMSFVFHCFAVQLCR
jgi:hypothetical protein